MKIAFLVLALFIFQSGCTGRSDTVSLPRDDPPIAAPAIADPQPPTTTDETLVYPGVTIDQQFPRLEESKFSDKGPESISIKAYNFEVNAKKFAPRTITRAGKTLFKFKTRSPKDYHSVLVGTSGLLGTRSKEIYTIALGPGAVCCTNYWITDVSKGKPREIFRSEEFGYFRDPMEVFDADGDGVYEIVQFDSVFRYFMNSCGACSPEPRAVFKYDKKMARYVPAAGLQQDFEREAFLLHEKELAEKYRMLKKDGPGADQEFYDSAFSYVARLFYLGKETKAWAAFEKYYKDNPDKRKIRAEIKFRINRSKYLRVLKRSVRNR